MCVHPPLCVRIFMFLSLPLVWAPPASFLFSYAVLPLLWILASLSWALFFSPIRLSIISLRQQRTLWLGLCFLGCCLLSCMLMFLYSSALPDFMRHCVAGSFSVIISVVTGVLFTAGKHTWTTKAGCFGELKPSEDSCHSVSVRRLLLDWPCKGWPWLRAPFFRSWYLTIATWLSPVSLLHSLFFASHGLCEEKLDGK